MKKYGEWIGEALLGFKEENRIKGYRIAELEEALRDIAEPWPQLSTSIPRLQVELAKRVLIARTALKETDQ